MANTKYQNPREKQSGIKRSGLLKKYVPILSDKLSQFKVKVSCEKIEGQDIKNIKIELCKSYSSDENIKEIKKIIIETGKFEIYPKVDDGYLLVSISFEKIDLFSRNPVKDVIVPLTKKVTPVGLVKDPLLIKKPVTDQSGVYTRTSIKENVSGFSEDIEEEIKDKYVFINSDVEAGLKQYEPIDIDEMDKVQQLPIRPADISISGSTETKVSEKVLFPYGKNQNESHKEEIGEDFKKLRNAISSALKSLGFNSQSDYISITSIAIGATINCKAESLNQMKTKLSALYPDKIYAIEGKKTIQVLNSFMESYLENATNNGKSTKMQTIDFSNTGKEKGKDKNTSPRANVLKQISLVNADTKTQQTQIQTTQKIEKMKKTQEKELRGHIKSLIKSLGLSAKVYYQISQTEDGHLDMYLRDAKDSAKFKDLSGVEVSDKHIYFSPHFTHGGNKKTTTLDKAKTSGKKKTEGSDALEDLFNKIRDIKSGPDLLRVAENFEEVYPGQTLWLQDGESSKKISIEVLLKKILK